jgi:hypothetical protein
VIQVNWDRNPFWNAALEAERQRSKADDPDRYDHIWEGVPMAATDGAIYRKEMHALSVGNRIRPIAEDPALTTHAIFDLGVADLTSITIAQADISGLRVLAFHEDHGLSLKDYSEWMGPCDRLAAARRTRTLSAYRHVVGSADALVWLAGADRSVAAGRDWHPAGARSTEERFLLRRMRRAA